MIKHFSEKELKGLLKSLSILVDTREQKNDHISSHFKSKNVNIIERKLDVGDYSCQIGDQTFEKSFVVERKRNLDELCANMTADRERFEREFLRAKANGIKVYLIIEDTTWDDIFHQNYRSKISVKSLLGSMLAWQTRYNVTILFCDKNLTASLIYGLFYYAAREEIVNGKQLQFY